MPPCGRACVVRTLNPASMDRLVLDCVCCDARLRWMLREVVTGRDEDRTEADTCARCVVLGRGAGRDVDGRLCVTGRAVELGR